jgi:hypothetical protein
MVRFGANSVMRCIGTSLWSTGCGKRAAILIVGWSLSPLPIPRRMPLRCRSAGVWMAPPHTKTCSASILSGSPARRHSAPVTRSPERTSRTTRQSGSTSAPSSTARGMSVRAIVCFTPREPWPSKRNTRGNSVDRQPSLVAPRSSSADDSGGATGSRPTDCHSSTRSA